MIRLANVIETFEADFVAQYRNRLSAAHYRALAAMKQCRTQASAKMQVKCTACDHQRLVPHSCGHRHCPHCQHHESQQWLERQLKNQVARRVLPADLHLACAVQGAGLIALLHVLLKFAPEPSTAWIKQRAPILCACCGAVMTIVRTQIRSTDPIRAAVPIPAPGGHADRVSALLSARPRRSASAS